jgi:hypothetical protein
MAWVKGQSGNPLGRAREKPFADALRLALAEEDPTTKKRKLRAIADKLVDAAVGGEPWAIKEVIDRIDGKAPQTIDATLTDERDLRDLTHAELIARIDAALKRAADAASGDGRAGPGEEPPSDVRKLN